VQPSDTSYDSSWDCPHLPGLESSWQESDWLTFYDPVKGVGGVVRIGQEPNRQKGQPNLFVFALGGLRFLMKDVGGRGLDCDIQPADRWGTGCRVAGHSVDALGEARMRFQWGYPETTGDLEFDDNFYVPRDWSTSDRGADVIAGLNADGHLECAGRLRGSVRIGEQRYQLNCFAHRDRSWGVRDHYMRRMNRAYGAWGTIGPELSFAIMRLELNDGRQLATGFVDRNGGSEDIADVTLHTTLDADLASPLRGVVIMSLVTGEIIRVECNLVQAHGGFAPGISFNAVGTIEYAGMTGFCDYSATANPSRGEHILTTDDVYGLAVEAGLSETWPEALPAR
jgi:hypothetical protein